MNLGGGELLVILILVMMAILIPLGVVALVAVRNRDHAAPPPDDPRQ